MSYSVRHLCQFRIRTSMSVVVNIHLSNNSQGIMPGVINFQGAVGSNSAIRVDTAVPRRMSEWMAGERSSGCSMPQMGRIGIRVATDNRATECCRIVNSSVAGCLVVAQEAIGEAVSLGARYAFCLPWIPKFCVLPLCHPNWCTRISAISLERFGFNSPPP